LRPSSKLIMTTLVSDIFDACVLAKLSEHPTAIIRRLANIMIFMFPDNYWSRAIFTIIYRY